jgi:hypothetical protein
VSVQYLFNKWTGFQNYPPVQRGDELLREANARWFTVRGLAVNPRFSYLLAGWEDWPKNIILPEVAKYIKDEQAQCIEQGRGFPLHKYIHHGLSSQAMLFNLIGPLVI